MLESCARGGMKKLDEMRIEFYETHSESLAVAE